MEKRRSVSFVAASCMNAALPFMDGEMRGFAARTLSKVEAMTEAEFAGLPIYAADEV